MDIERIRYSIARYLRARLLKIEKDLDYIASSINAMDRLSADEKDFVSKLNAINNSSVEESVLKRLNPETSREVFETQSMSNRLKNAQPDLQDFVFCEALKDINGIKVGPDSIQDLREGIVLSCLKYLFRSVLIPIVSENTNLALLFL